jgi:hypothetical protein
MVSYWFEFYKLREAVEEMAVNSNTRLLIGD